MPKVNKREESVEKMMTRSVPFQCCLLIATLKRKDPISGDGQQLWVTCHRHDVTGQGPRGSPNQAPVLTQQQHGDGAPAGWIRRPALHQLQKLYRRDGVTYAEAREIEYVLRAPTWPRTRYSTAV